MARKRKELSRAADDYLRRRALAGDTAANIAEALGGGISESTVLRRMREIRRPRPKPAAVVAPADAPPSPSPDDVRRTRDERHHELCAQAERAETREEERAADVEILRLLEPDVAKILDEGRSLVDALTSTTHGNALIVLAAPADLAELVWFLTGDKTDAIELLTATIEAVRARAEVSAEPS